MIFHTGENRMFVETSKSLLHDASVCRGAAAYADKPRNVGTIKPKASMVQSASSRNIQQVHIQYNIYMIFTIVHVWS